MDKHSATTRLLNGLAICSMHSKKFEDAEKHLLEALEKVYFPLRAFREWSKGGPNAKQPTNKLESKGCRDNR